MSGGDMLGRWFRGVVQVGVEGREKCGVFSAVDRYPDMMV